MDVFEAALSKEINLIIHEHDKFWNKVLSEDEDGRSREDIKLPKTGVTDLNDFINIENIYQLPRQRRRKMSSRTSRSASNKLDPAAIYMENNEKVRTCQNMNGVLGK